MFVVIVVEREHDDDEYDDDDDAIISCSLREREARKKSEASALHYKTSKTHNRYVDDASFANDPARRFS